MKSAIGLVYRGVSFSGGGGLIILNLIACYNSNDDNNLDKSN